jgi:hypothetical protein
MYYNSLLLQSTLCLPFQGKDAIPFPWLLIRFTSVVSHKYLYNMSFRSEARNLNNLEKIQDISPAELDYSRWSI